MDGLVYLLHFERPYKHARHYLGWTVNLKRRMYQHKYSEHAVAGLLRAVRGAGISWHVVRTWPGDRTLERKLRDRGSMTGLCPECLPEHRLRNAANERRRLMYETTERREARLARMRTYRVARSAKR